MESVAQKLTVLTDLQDKGIIFYAFNADKGLNLLLTRIKVSYQYSLQLFFRF